MIVALMLLLVMTVLAVSGIGNSVLEQRMSGNYFHSATSFEAAEFGLRVAEQWLQTAVTDSTDVDNWFRSDTTSNGLYTTQDTTTPSSVEVCRGDFDCQFDPRNENQWCAGGSGCGLPKGFVTLGETLEGVTLEALAIPVARQPRFIIEEVGQVDAELIARLDSPAEGLAIAPTAFRITVIGWGPEGASRHVLQSHYLLRL